MEKKKKQPEGCCCRTPVQCSSDSKQQHLFVLAACGNVLLLLMFLRLTWIVWVVMHIYLSFGRLFQAWKAEVKVYRSVYKIMPPTFHFSERQEFRTGKQAKEKQRIGNNILLTFWEKKSPNNSPCPSCPLKTAAEENPDKTEHINCRERGWQAGFWKNWFIWFEFLKCAMLKSRSYRNQSSLVAFYRLYRESLCKPYSSASCNFFFWKWFIPQQVFLQYLIAKSTEMIKIKCFFLINITSFCESTKLSLCSFLFSHTLKKKF